MNWLKILTKNGRRELARELLRPVATPEEIAKLSAQGISIVLERGVDKLTDERVAQIAVGCERGGLALSHLAAAVNPEGDGGKTVTEKERVQIANDMFIAVNALVTQDQLDALVEKAVTYVP